MSFLGKAGVRPQFFFFFLFSFSNIFTTKSSPFSATKIEELTAGSLLLLTLSEKSERVYLWTIPTRASLRFSVICCVFFDVFLSLSWVRILSLSLSLSLSLPLPLSLSLSLSLSHYSRLGFFVRKTQGFLALLYAPYNFVQRHVSHSHTPFVIPMRTLQKLASCLFSMLLLLHVSFPLYLPCASCVTLGWEGHNKWVQYLPFWTLFHFRN